MENEIQSFIEQNPYVDAIVLKSKSPSCGTGTTPILNSLNEHIGYGSGIASKMLQKHFENLIVQDEMSFASL